MGAEKYNRYLQTDCPDNMLQHAYEEALDLAVYLKTQIEKKKLKDQLNALKSKFAYEQEIEALKNMGLGLGGTIESVIVYNDKGWLNQLRYEDELVRHKILDVIGDLRLAGIIRGHVIAVKSGHALNALLAKQLAAAFYSKG